MPDDMSNCPDLQPFREDKTELQVAPGLPKRILEIPNNPNLREGDVRHIGKVITSALEACQRL
jgi:dTDP-4-amino-4,6-dideoxygalactose transaminase